MTSAQIIREARLKAELTQAELAERLGRDRAQIARWETAGRSRASRTFARWSRPVASCSSSRSPSARMTRLWTPSSGRACCGRRSNACRRSSRTSTAGERAAVRSVCAPGGARPGEGQLRRDRRLRPGRARKRRDDPRPRHRSLASRGEPPPPRTCPRSARRHRQTASRSSPEQLGSPEPLRTRTRAGELMVVPMPWGTRGYDDLRIRSFRDNLGRGIRPSVVSVVDCVRMLAASERDQDHERLTRLRRTHGARTPTRSPASAHDRTLTTAPSPLRVQQLLTAIASETHMHRGADMRHSCCTLFACHVGAVATRPRNPSNPNRPK